MTEGFPASGNAGHPLEENEKALANDPQHVEELRRFRAEAAALLGVKQQEK